MSYPASAAVATGDLATAAQYNNLRSDAVTSRQRKRKASTQTVNNSTTLVDDSALQFAVGANDVWLFEILVYVATSAVAGFKWELSLPAGAAYTLTQVFRLSGADPQALDATRQLTAGQQVAFGGATVSEPVILKGVYVGGANAGTFKLQWAQNAAEVSNTQVLAGSFLIADQVS